MAYPLLIVAIALGVAGQHFFKASVGTGAGGLLAMLNGRLLIGLSLYGLSTVAYLLALRSLPLSVAFPSLALGYAAVAWIGCRWHGEQLAWWQVGGLILVIAGVSLLHLRPGAGHG